MKKCNDTYDFQRPAPYYVYVTVSPTKRNGIAKAFTSRAGVAHDEAGILKVIQDDLTEMGKTFGGLIDPVGVEGRSYRAFKAEWTEVDIVRAVKALRRSK
jgi:hypothetical protein